VKRLSAFIVFFFLCALAAESAAQKSASPQAVEIPAQAPMFTAAELAAKVPAAKADDVKSMDAILVAIYDVISGPAGDRDWNRFRSLFLPEARFTDAGKNPDGSAVIFSWGVEEFIRDAKTVFAKDPFYEKAIVNKPDVYGNVAQVISSYESRHAAAEKPFQRGINSIQLFNDGKRWWVLSILWDSEREGNPLPAKFAGK